MFAPLVGALVPSAVAKSFLPIVRFTKIPEIRVRCLPFGNANDVGMKKCPNVPKPLVKPNTRV